MLTMITTMTMIMKKIVTQMNDKGTFNENKNVYDNDNDFKGTKLNDMLVY